MVDVMPGSLVGVPVIVTTTSDPPEIAVYVWLSITVMKVDPPVATVVK